MDASPQRWHLQGMRDSDNPGPLAPLSTRTLLLCAAFFAACCHGLLFRCVPRQAAPPSAARIDEGPPEAWVTDGDSDAGTIARPMPPKPFEGQKKPPCGGKHQVEIRGGCWVELARKPEDDLCGSEGFQHDGRCYVPVKRAERPPTSVMP